MIIFYMSSRKYIIIETVIDIKDPLFIIITKLDKLKYIYIFFNNLCNYLCRNNQNSISFVPLLSPRTHLTITKIHS